MTDCPGVGVVSLIVQKLAAGLHDGVVRLSIGIEAADDLLDDLDRALRRAVVGGVGSRVAAADNTFDAGPLCVGECDQIGYVDPGGSWRLAHEVAWAPFETNFFYGNPADSPFMGDWDCDGVDTPGLYRRSDGYAYLRNLRF